MISFEKKCVFASFFLNNEFFEFKFYLTKCMRVNFRSDQSLLARNIIFLEHKFEGADIDWESKTADIDTLLHY